MSTTIDTNAAANATELAQRCASMNQGADAAIHWIADARKKSERLDHAGDDLVREFRRIKNKTTRLSNAASRPMSVGFFGLSQAGKSYLISSLAVNKAGELETEMDGKRLNFISHINPPGSGIAESTGLVTRFTRKQQQQKPGFPVRLTLFSEADLIKILGNSFFKDFDPQKVTFDVEPSAIHKVLQAVEPQRQSSPVAGLTPDDVVDLMDYFQHNFAKSMEPLMAEYWPTAIELAPFLPLSARATLFSVLWGDIGIMTDLYQQLRRSLDDIGHAAVVHTPMDSLVQVKEDGSYSQADSIINVAMLERLGSDEADVIPLIPEQNGEFMGQAQLPRSILAALTAELCFTLADAPKAAILENIDLLDFPGYRGRLNVGGVDDIAAEVEDENANPVKEIFLRGKVAYLFERYTEDQEMNALILCTACDQQMNITSLGPVLEKWIYSTQGETAAIRAKRQAGLIWCITKFDKRLDPKPGSTLDTIRLEWAGMMKGVLLEKFGKYSWLKEWNPSQAFNNLFLVRKPRMAQAVIETTKTEELHLKQEHEPRLAEMRQVFTEEETVAKHFQDPGAAWDAMMALNDGGMGHLASYLEAVAQPKFKLSRIAEQVDKLAENVVEHYLGSYHQAGGEAEREQKKAIADSTMAALMQVPDRLGELLHLLEIDSETLRTLYLQGEDDKQQGDDDGDTPAVKPAGASVLIDLPGASIQQQTTPGAQRAKRFVGAAISAWLTKVRRLPRHQTAGQYLRLEEADLQAITDEIINGFYRFKLEDKMVAALQANELQTSATRADLADRQVLTVKRLFDDYLGLLGQHLLPLDERAAVHPQSGRSGTVFTAPPPILEGQLPDLPTQPIQFSSIFILDWLQAYKNLVIENAGQSGGQEITQDQNVRLGEILSHFQHPANDANPALKAI